MALSSADLEGHTMFSTHPDYAGKQVDFSDFWDGASCVGENRSNFRTAGGFRGRPVMARALLDAARQISVRQSPTSLRVLRSHLRIFWRFLDSFEKMGNPNLEAIEHIESVHGLLWTRPPPGAGWLKPSYGQYIIVKRLLLLARHNAGYVEAIFWPVIDSPGTAIPDVITPAEARSLYIDLKHRAYKIYARWIQADQLARIGRCLSELKNDEVMTAADSHAIYRELIGLMHDAVPTREALKPELKSRGYKGVFSVGLRELQAGLYPTVEDLEVFFYLFLLKTGWNPQVAADIDTSNGEWVKPIGDQEANLWHLQSFKARSRNWQDTVSHGKPSTDPYQIIQRLLKRTAPLRALAFADPTRCGNATIAARSPWLAAANSAGSRGTHVMAPKSSSNFFKRLIREHNDAASKNLSFPNSGNEAEAASKFRLKIPEHIKVSDFRDVFISNAFVESRYSWIVAMWAAGHSYSSSTRRYLQSNVWRLASDKSLSEFNKVLLDEIVVHRIVDPTILRARSQGHQITESQRKAWESLKDRTYVGAACANPLNPPPEIDPTNPRDGMSVCRAQTRCTLCSHGLFFWNSMPMLARRLAELKALQSSMSITAWVESTLSAELAATLATLAQWPKIAVEQEVRLWVEKIKAGLHRSFVFTGFHHGR